MPRVLINILQSINQMKKIILAAMIMLLAVGSQAQPKIPSIDPRIKKGVEEKKRVDKILNATVVKINFIASDYNFSPTIYSSRILQVHSLRKGGGFSYNYNFGKISPVEYNSASRSTYWQFNFNGKTVTYKDLMNEGFEVTMQLQDPQRNVSKPLKANFAVEFIFSDGNRVVVSMVDEITIPGHPQMHFEYPNLASFRKTFAGPTNVIPDPENPLKVPEIK